MAGGIHRGDNICQKLVRYKKVRGGRESETGRESKGEAVSFRHAGYKGKCGQRNARERERWGWGWGDRLRGLDQIQVL